MFSKTTQPTLKLPVKLLAIQCEVCSSYMEIRSEKSMSLKSYGLF